MNMPRQPNMRLVITPELSSDVPSSSEQWKITQRAQTVDCYRLTNMSAGYKSPLLQHTDQLVALGAVLQLLRQPDLRCVRPAASHARCHSVKMQARRGPVWIRQVLSLAAC
jgi:hypothetical protein